MSVRYASLPQVINDAVLQMLTPTTTLETPETTLRVSVRYESMFWVMNDVTFQMLETTSTIML